MNQTIQPLRQSFSINEDSAISVQEQIRERVRSEDNYTHCKGYPLIKSEDINKGQGR